MCRFGSSVEAIVAFQILLTGIYGHLLLGTYSIDVQPACQVHSQHRRNSDYFKRGEFR